MDTKVGRIYTQFYTNSGRGLYIKNPSICENYCNEFRIKLFKDSIKGMTYITYTDCTRFMKLCGIQYQILVETIND